jgi:hypothetical protein
MLSLNDGHTCQLDAIPTVGFSDPILSYFSALQFSFDGVRMLREGYEKVISFFVMSSHFLNVTHDTPTHRQDQVYSKSPIFGDGWCLLPDLSSSMMSGGLQMMSCLCWNQRSKYVSMRIRSNTHKGYLVHSTRIHAGLTEHERLIPRRCYTF